jgi:elongation factor 1 alpha-like protein
MRISTISAREALGTSGANISDAQIQEALWHYYYDVGKSVSYLKNKFAAPAPKPAAQPKKEKATSRFDQAASAAVEKAPLPAGKHSHEQYSYTQSTYPVASILPLPPVTMPSNAEDFFADVPWGKVPAHRLGVITVDEPHFRGGLLGGSSKLAALAAKRRKEREEAQAASTANGETDAAVAMLDKLTVKSKDGTTPAHEADRPSRISKYTARKRSPSPKPEAPVEETTPEPEAPKPAIEVEHPAQRATASMFASTLCGTSHSARSSNILQEFPAPYSHYKDYQNARPFEGPSPDDIVRAAQANKGAGTGRR